MFKPRFTPYFDADDGISAIGGAASTEDDPAEPDGDDPSDGGDSDDPEDDPAQDPDNPETDPPAEPAKPQQTPEENAKFAEIRRKYEAENKRLLAELEAERASKKQVVDEVVQTAFRGQINPYTEQPIETQEDYEAYQEMYRQDMLNQIGLPKDFIQKEIENNPIVRQAQEILEAQKAQQGRIAFEAQLSEINRLNPNIKTVDDLLNMPEKEEFDRYVNKGYELIDAFRLVHKDGKRKTNTTDTKEHLIPAGGAAGTNKETDIPSSLLETWKEAFPNETNEQLRGRYNRYLKRAK